MIIGFETAVECYDCECQIRNRTYPYFTAFIPNENGGKFVRPSFDYAVQNWNTGGVDGRFYGTISFSNVKFNMTDKQTWNLAFTLNINHSSNTSAGGNGWNGSTNKSYNMQINSYQGTITYYGNGQTSSYRCTGLYADNTVTVTLSNTQLY